MSTILYLLTLFAHAAPACRVLHVTDASAPAAFAAAQTEVETLVKAQNPGCAVLSQVPPHIARSKPAPDQSFVDRQRPFGDDARVIVVAVDQPACAHLLAFIAVGMCAQRSMQAVQTLR